MTRASIQQGGGIVRQQPSANSVHGERLLSAVERLVDDSESLVAQVEALREDVDSSLRHPDHGPFYLNALAVRIIRGYSNRSAFSGGVTSLPSMLPGGGTMVALVGGSLADMTMMLKHEVEMALCLTHLYGYDIREERARWLGYTLVAVNTYEAKTGRNFFLDVAEAQLEALTKYTPRQLSKLVVTGFGKYALLSLSRGFLKALPLVGIAVSASANKLIVDAVGWRCVEALDRLRSAEGDDPGSIVDAKVI
jgi:uncharacterized protein (DUF697 family)